MLTLQSLPRLVSSFLEGFRFPSLTSLNISIPDAENARPFPINSLILLLQRSQCELQHLVLKQVPIPRESMMNILRATPTLVSLVIHEPASYTHCITDAFSRYLMECSVLPKLEHVELVWSYDASEGCIIDMIESRVVKTVAYGGVLGRIVLGRRKGLELERSTIERVNSLRGRGFHILLWQVLGFCWKVLERAIRHHAES
ncbi:uncharacterized protein BT62DRAFT_792671 [Guyanagaster necrorhizus]|uniref:Uncharacterized protein n=1 Tax=Guyanagaster necrorhizus TaxID=856835 RepID=A0A9P7VW49_9AGAR|nr:uncharacterized protein BT62DRAFT_792671 [Guyanagaster necrorhizus MCA 3950]KAG7447790.1 hypothetical protein BT62DRAFT_792671 [Guyanagaster necrorhizus MCA 3950]